MRDSVVVKRELLRLQTLVRLRWLALAGQSVAVLVVDIGLGFDVPQGPCFTLIALSAWLNIFLRLHYSAALRLTPNSALAMLCYDVLQLGGLLYFTGGMQNPFAILLLAPCLISASSLPLRHTFLLGSLIIALAAALTFYHWPLPWFSGALLQLPMTYILGMWAAFVISLTFMAVYAFQIASEARLLSDALAAAELILAREQQLSALDGLAAAAAHELGTPLSTIALIVKELLGARGMLADHQDDLALLKSQTDRCRQILATLTSLDSEAERDHVHRRLSDVIAEASAPHRGFGAEIEIFHHNHASNGAGEPLVMNNPGMIYGLENLIENAVDFARSRVIISLGWSDERIWLHIRDDGPGFSPEVMDRLGDPYVTSRPLAKDAVAGDEFGLGLGFFIAKTMLDRSGARLAMYNAAPPESGANITITWPRGLIEVGLHRLAAPSDLTTEPASEAPSRILS